MPSAEVNNYGGSFAPTHLSSPTNTFSGWTLHCLSSIYIVGTLNYIINPKLSKSQIYLWGKNKIYIYIYIYLSNVVYLKALTKKLTINLSVLPAIMDTKLELNNTSEMSPKPNKLRNNICCISMCHPSWRGGNNTLFQYSIRKPPRNAVMHKGQPRPYNKKWDHLNQHQQIKNPLKDIGEDNENFENNARKTYHKARTVPLVVWEHKYTGLQNVKHKQFRVDRQPHILGALLTANEIWDHLKEDN